MKSFFGLFKTTAEPARSAFSVEVLRDKQDLLRANLEKLDVRTDKVGKILERRGQLPDRYDEIPSPSLSRAFEVLENSSVPSKPTVLTEHRMALYRTYARELLSEVDEDARSQNDPLLHETRRSTFDFSRLYPC